MSNNIYDILKKMQGLEAPAAKTQLTESRSMNTVKELHHESKKEKQTRKGTIAEAVAQVEQQLNEKYMGFKKKIVETKVEESGLQAYLGKKKYGETGMKALQKAGREGASKEKMAMIRAKHDKMDEDRTPEIGSKLPKSDTETFGLEPGRGYTMNTPKDWKPGDKRRDPQQLIPTQDKKDHIRSRLGKHVKPKNLPEGEYHEDMLSAKDKSFAALAEPRDKITYADKIAGAKKGKKTEGNKFSGNLMKARAQGLDKADLDGDGDMEKVSKGASTMREGWEEMQKYLDKKRGPESKGGAGKKAGTRYGGSAQQDDDEETDGEGKPVEKKKGRPKGTGTGAKHNFKKPKD
jgi:hypothetical protein